MADFAGEGCSTGGAVTPAFAFIVGIVIRRIANHPSSAGSGNAAASRAEEFPDDFYRQKLKEARGAGVEALNDPEIEKRVEAYFRENPGFSRDAVHVAAVACQFKKEQVMASRRQEACASKVSVTRGSERRVPVASKVVLPTGSPTIETVSRSLAI